MIYIRDHIPYEEWPDDTQHMHNLAEALDRVMADSIDNLKRAWRAEEALERCRKALKV